jgi:heme-degrading monooxygenase HmoA
MIGRIWHGYTAKELGDAYEELLKTEVFVSFEQRGIPGYMGIQLFRREMEAETEFVTIMWFDSLEAVRHFAGEDYEVAVVPPKAQAILSRYDLRSQHYEVRAISESLFGG